MSVSLPYGLPENNSDAAAEGALNVKDYGARGDGSNDDAGAIQAAITDAVSTGVTDIHIPPGTYMLSTTLLLPNATALRITGAGMGNTILKLQAAKNCDVISNTSFASQTGTTSSSGIFRVTLQGFTVDGNKANQTTAGYGIRIYGRAFVFRDLVIQSCFNSGLYTEYGAVDNFAAPSGLIESQYNNIQTTHNGDNGFEFWGPHDSYMSTFTSFGNGARDSLSSYTYTTWLPSTAYALNAYVLNGSRLYRCATAGTSSATVYGGPFTTASGVTDGTAVWNYIADAAGWGVVLHKGMLATGVDTYLNPPSSAITTGGGIWIVDSGVLNGSNISATTGSTGRGMLIDRGTGDSTISGGKWAGTVVGLELKSTQHTLSGAVVNTTTTGVKLNGGSANMTFTMFSNAGNWFDVAGQNGASIVTVDSLSTAGTLFSGSPAGTWLITGGDVSHYYSQIGSSSSVTTTVPGGLTADVIGNLTGTASVATTASNIGGYTAAQAATSIGSTIAATSNNTASTLMLRNSFGLSRASNNISALTANTTSQVLTVNSTWGQTFTSASALNCTLPDATTLVLGHSFRVANKGTANVTVKYSGGTFLATLTPNTAAEFVCSSISTAAGTWDVDNLAIGPQDIRYYGATGSSDDTTFIQAAIDANKGGVVYIPSGTYIYAGVLLSGSTYDNTKIVGLGGELKLKASASGTNFGSSWVGLIIKDCTGVTVEGVKFDGNRSAQPAVEATHTVGLAGAIRTTFRNCDFRQIRGDGIYVNMSTWGSNTTNSSNLVVEDCNFYNSADDGRNAISIISCDGVTLSNIDSYQIGGTIGATLEPGGIDFEPNATYHSITDVVVDGCNIVSAGTGGFNVLGKAITSDATRDWNCSNFKISGVSVFRTGTTGSGLSASNLFRCRNVTIDADSTYIGSGYGAGWTIDYADKVRGQLKASHCSVGVQVGFTDEVRDFDLKVLVSDYSSAGLKTGFITRGRFSGRVSNSISVASSTPIGIQCHDNARGSIVQTNVTYSVDAPYDSVMAKGFRNEVTRSVTYTNCFVRDCDMTGYATFATMFDVNAVVPFRVNVQGLSATSIPTTGYFLQGEFVPNTAPSTGAITLTGWHRLTTGTAHVTATDWNPAYTFTNAGTYAVNFNQSAVSNGVVGIAPAAAVAQDAAIRVVFPAVTGTSKAILASGQGTTDWRAEFANSDNTNSTANTTLYLKVGGASGGDPRVVFDTNGGTSWAAGVDNSDGDKLKFSSGTALGTNDALTIDANLNATFSRNAVMGYTTTATAAGTTTLTVTSTYYQFFTGATTQTLVLPDATTLALGWHYRVHNASSGTVTINANGGGLVKSLTAGNNTTLVCTGIGSAAGTWVSLAS